MYEIIFSDYDGTLYGRSRKISDKTKEKINEFVSQGGKFVISTGRIYESIKPICLDLKLDGDCISSQGSQIYNIKDNLAIKTDLLDVNKTVEILKLIKDRGFLSQVYASNKIYADTDIPFNSFFSNFFGVNINNTDKLIDMVESKTIAPNKFECLVDEDKINDFIKELKERFPDFLFSKSAPVMIEIADKNATKGKSVEYLLKKYNIKKENAVAIGDGNNDIDMLEAVGKKVAVNNAAKKLLAKADYITKDTNGDGVAEIIDLILDGKF